MVTTPRANSIIANSASSTAAAKPKPTLELLPDTRFLVFAGDQHEASSVRLTGRVRLNCPEATSISKPRIRLEGKRKIGWVFMGGIGSGVVEDRAVFLSQERRLGGIESAHKVNAGRIEWPFDFELSPAMPESVEGLRDTFVVYHLYASVSRPGWNAKDVTARARLRIVRTLGQDSIETARSRVNADIWANKLSYSISIPTDTVVFGTSITAAVELSPIRKGLRLGRVEMKLMETVVKRIQPGDQPDATSARPDRARSEESEVAKSHMDFPEGAMVTYEQESPDEPVLADEMYRFHATLPLPKSLNRCRQDVDSHHINISHRFKLMVNIHNPEGHISQLVCRLPVKLFISPNLPINESNEVHASLNGATDAELNNAETTIVPPPQYGRHILDQMYSDIDLSGYMSRTGSGPATPADASAQSRRGSDENLRSLNEIADANDLALHGSATPAVLRSRLADLQEEGGGGGGGGISPPGAVIASTHPTLSGGASPGTAAVTTDRMTPPEQSASQRHSNRRSIFQRHSSYFGASAQQSSSSPDEPAAESSRTSAEEEPAAASASASASAAGSAPESLLSHADFNLTHLSRVPSYNAAMRTPGPVTPFDQRPPSYVEVTSRPPSPPPPPLPGSTRMRDGIADAQPTTAAAAAGRPVAARASASLEEEEVRLRMLRAAS